MKRLVAVTVLISLTAAVGGCSAAVFGPTGARPGQLTVLQRFNFWLAEGDNCQAVLWGHESLAHRVAGGEWCPAGQGAAFRIGPGQVEVWEIAVDLGWVPPGSYAYEGKLGLDGGAGLVWHWGEMLQVMPLNSHDFAVWAEEGAVFLAPGKWHAFSDPVEIRWQGEHVPVGSPARVHSSTYPEWTVEEKLRWLVGRPAIRAGESAALTVRLTGPAPAAVLEVALPPWLVLQGMWEVSAGATDQRYDGVWLVEIPALDAGESVDVTGVVAALLPPRDLSTEVEAVWQGLRASLPLRIGRGWFARPSQLQLAATRAGKPAADVEFILADGTRVRSDASGRLAADVGPGLQPIFLADNPRVPYWVTALPELPTCMEVELAQAGVQPVTVFGSGVMGAGGRWQAAVHGSGFRALAEAGSSQIQLGDDWQAELNHGSLAVSRREALQSYRDGKWWWQGRNNGWRGVYRSAPLNLAVDVPARGVPDLHIQVQEGRVQVAASSRGIAVSCTGPQFSFGADSSRSVAWAAIRPANLRMAVSPKGWSLQRQSAAGRLVVEWQFGDGLIVEAEHPNLSVAARVDSVGSWRWGMYTHLGRGWNAALQVVDTHCLLELCRSGGWRVTKNLAAFASGSLQLGPYGLGYHWQAGVQLTPLPWLGAQLSYDSLSGLDWQVGFTFAF